jgi:hypothetical protein
MSEFAKINAELTEINMEINNLRRNYPERSKSPTLTLECHLRRRVILTQAGFQDSIIPFSQIIKERAPKRFNNALWH